MTRREEELGRAYLQLQERYDDLVKHSPAGIFRTTIQGRFLECNEALVRMLGYASREELMRTPCIELYVDPAERGTLLTRLREEKQLVSHPVVLRHRSGRPIHVLENVYLSEQEGRPAAVVGTLINVTDLRQTELEQRMLIDNYRQLVEHARDGILIVEKGRVRYANPAAGTMCGREITGEECVELFHPDDRPMVNGLLVANRTGSATSADARLISKGEAKGVRVYADASTHQGSPATQLTIQDIGLQQSLLQERTRATMAEEVNRVLRQEIADHRRTQEALRQSRRFARSLIDSSLDMIMAADPAGRITEYNPAASLKFGYEPDEAIGHDTRMLYAEASEYERVQRELNEHGVYAGEVRNITRDGTVFTSFLAASRLYDEGGQLLGAMGVSRDITTSKRDREALVASEERYRDLFENATDLIQSVDADGRFQYVNTAWRDALGYDGEEIARMTIWEIVHPDEREHCEEAIKRIMNGEPAGPIRTVFVAKDGREVHVVGNSNARFKDGRAVATRSIFRDITGVHEAQEQVQQHAAKLRALFESSEHMFWTVDPRVALTSFNRGYAEMIERLYGTRPEVNTDPGMARKKFASAEYHAFWEGKYMEAFDGRPLRFETDLRDQQGRRVCNEIFLSPVFDPDGGVKEVFGVGHEITEQKEAEDRVREHEARLKAIFENSANMMIWTLDHQLRLTSFNKHFHISTLRAFGIDFKPGDDFVKAHMPNVAGRRYERLVAKYHQALDGFPQQFEVELRNHAGRPLWVENFLNPITVDGRVTEISCLAYGITDRKDAQKKLIESLHEKEVLLKEVHHRVKNNLQVISSILNLQGGYVGRDPRMLDLLRDSQDRIRSMAFIHESLYQTKNFNSVDLGVYIESLSRNLMMSYSLGGKVRLDTQVQPVELGLDQAIPCGLMLNELISNALKHAFPSGREGVIEIRVELIGEEVTIAIADNGVGPPAGFDVAKHANLGLQLVQMLTSQLDGRFERMGTSGSRFRITFSRATTTA